GIWIGRIATDRQLVASDIKRANHDRASAERLDYVSIGPILLLLVRHRSAPHDEELGAHQAHTFSTAASGELGFLRQVDVCPQRYPVTVQGNRVRGCERLELLILEGLHCAALAVDPDLASRRSDDEYAGS